MIDPANMSERNAECDDWMSKPNVCRFCISTTGSFDLTALYMSADGGREVLLYMLEDCYSITLSNISEWGPSRVVCDSCSTRLRHAYCFKQQVLQAEESFKEYLSKNGDSEDVKIEEHGSIEIEENEDIVERIGLNEIKCEVDNENIYMVEDTDLGEIYKKEGNEEINMTNYINQPDSTITNKESEQKKRGKYHPKKRKKKPKRKLLTHVKKRTKAPITKQLIGNVKDLTNLMFTEDNKNINIVNNPQYSMKKFESKLTQLKVDTASKMKFKTAPVMTKYPNVSRKRMKSASSTDTAEEDIGDFCYKEDREGMDSSDILIPQDSKVYELELGLKTDGNCNANKRKRKRKIKFTHVKQRTQAVGSNKIKSNIQDRKRISPNKRVQTMAKKIYDKVKVFCYDTNEAPEGPGNTGKRVNNESKRNAKTSNPIVSTTKSEPEFKEIQIINASNTDIETKRPVIKKNIILDLSRKRKTSTSSAEDAEAIDDMKDANDKNNQNMDTVKNSNTENLNQKPNNAKSVKCQTKKRTVRNNEDKIVAPKRVRKAMIITCSDDSDSESESNIPTLIANTLKEKELEFSDETIERVRKTMQRNVTCDTVLNYTTACPFRKDVGKLRCLYCPNVFCNISELRKHIPSHVSIDLTKIIRKITILTVDITDLKCTICNTALKDADDMIKHFIDTHSKVIYSDCLSVHVLSNETNIQTEIGKSGDEIDGEKCLEPTVGPKKTKQRPETRHSMITCETILKHTTACPFKEHASMFHCLYCTKPFTEFATLKKHVTQNHTPEDLNDIIYPSKLQIDICDFQCTICNIDLVDIDNMVQHFSDAHNKIVYKKCVAGYKLNEIPYLCHVCNETRFDEFKHLAAHLDEHSANGLCDVCGDLFLNPKRLGDHKRRTHAKYSNPCTGKSEGAKDKRNIIKVKRSKCIDVEGVRKILLKAKLANVKSAGAVQSIMSKSADIM